MTVIAWDGKRLAGDKRTNFGGLHGITTKVHRLRGYLVGGAGVSARISEMCAWFERGAIPIELPDSQKDEDKCVSLLVINPEGQAWRYENSAYPMRIENPFWAIGSGRDFAMAAMHLGCSAIEAVQIACIYETSCGNGVDWLELS